VAAAPDTAGVTRALAKAAPPAPRPESRPLFQSMFSDPAPGAVNRTVSALWTPATAQTPAAGQSAVPAPLLNLFTSGQPNPRSLFRGG